MNFLLLSGMAIEARCLILPEELKADHPFIVALVATSQESVDNVLFCGRINAPKVE